MKILCSLLLLVTLAGCGAGISDFSEKISGKYYYHSTSSIDRFIAPKMWGLNTPIIPSKVVKFKYNKEYVIAKRQEIEISESGSRLPTPHKYDYWILEVSSPVIFGPLNHDEYLVKREELNLPDSLNLK